VERLRPWVAGVADRLVAGFAERLRDGEPSDLIAAVAEPLPVEVIAELLACRRPTGGCCGPGPTRS